MIWGHGEPMPSAGLLVRQNGKIIIAVETLAPEEIEGMRAGKMDYAPLFERTDRIAHALHHLLERNGFKSYAIEVQT